MWVAELSKRSGVSADNIRYYTRLGLLKPKREHGNGYRVYEESDIARLRYIRSAQQLGYTLAEINEFLDILDEGGSPVDKMKSALMKNVSLRQLGMAKQVAEFGRMAIALTKWDECLEPVMSDLGDLEQKLNSLLAADAASREIS